MRWDPDRYSTFERERAQPFHDLVARIRPATPPRRVVDLGCGPGTLTATLAARWPDAEVVGIDSSDDMLEKARGLEDAPSNLRFERAGIADWRPTQADDIVVTNAALHWVPEHRTLLPDWLSALPGDAWFALQVPGNFAAPDHALMRSIAAEPPFRDVLDGVLEDDPVDDAAGYLRTFQDAGWSANAWETTYLQVLQGPDPVLEWVRGAGLRPVLQALEDADPLGRAGAAFEDRYRSAVANAYPRGPHGTIHPFRRIFAVGNKA